MSNIYLLDFRATGLKQVVLSKSQLFSNSERRVDLIESVSDSIAQKRFHFLSDRFKMFYPQAMK